MKKALVLFAREIERENLVDSAIFMQSQGFEILPLYIRDMSREKMMSATDGLLVGNRAPYLVQGWDEIEQGEIENIESLFAKKNLKVELKVDIGLISDVVTEYMKDCDILMVGRNETLTDNTVALLKANYKSMILVGKRPLTKLETVALANDNGVKISRSTYQFVNVFGEIENFKSYSINKEIEENAIVNFLKRRGKKVEHMEITTNSTEAMERFNGADLLIMGNLSKSYLFEKITGKNGIKLIEKVEAPIFIG